MNEDNLFQTSNPISGTFAIDKPEGFTSFDVVAKLRGILGIKKIGHGGTLDPLATGVLPIFIGSATRAIDLISDQTKRYIATAVFTKKTDTGDISGRVIEKNGFIPNLKQLETSINSFLGKSLQLPPMYSAVKINGKRLYDIARTGKSVERTPREIEILAIKLLEFKEEQKEFAIDVSCSKGVYIRTLVEDIAESLGSLSTLKELRRIKSGPFVESDCIKIETVITKKEQHDFSFINPVDILFKDVNEILLTKEQYIAFNNGVKIPFESNKAENIFKVCHENNLLALARIYEGRIKSIARFK